MIGSGFDRVSDMYTNGKLWVQLIKGHTWSVSSTGNRFGKDIKYLEELLVN